MFLQRKEITKNVKTLFGRGGGPVNYSRIFAVSVFVYEPDNYSVTYYVFCEKKV
jgi:hypothetical protein